MNFVLASLTIIVNFLPSEFKSAYVLIASSILDERPMPIGILVRVPAPTNPDAPCISIRDVKSLGIHVISKLCF